MFIASFALALFLFDLLILEVFIILSPKNPNIPANLVLFFSGASFLFWRFLKSSVTNQLKILFLLMSKKVRVIYL